MVRLEYVLLQATDGTLRISDHEAFLVIDDELVDQSGECCDLQLRPAKLESQEALWACVGDLRCDLSAGGELSTRYVQVFLWKTPLDGRHERRDA